MTENDTIFLGNFSQILKETFESHLFLSKSNYQSWIESIKVGFRYFIKKSQYNRPYCHIHPINRILLHPFQRHIGVFLDRRNQSHDQPIIIKLISSLVHCYESHPQNSNFGRTHISERCCIQVRILLC